MRPALQKCKHKGEHKAASVGVACGAFSTPRGLAVPDDNKHTERVPLWLTEREFLDLVRMSERHDRRPGEMARVIVRRFMYGNVGPDGADIQCTKGAEPPAPFN